MVARQPYPKGKKIKNGKDSQIPPVAIKAKVSNPNPVNIKPMPEICFLSHLSPIHPKPKRPNMVINGRAPAIRLEVVRGTPRLL